ncbi:ATP-binding protein [Pseudoalteromonas sp. Of7M-16]|uniref:ATP-binding protein n=1 Tax=Pseudoalteromonas sp. Of7M-16 TaxID=2917756 RepID=UPI001EF513C3|nr:ATP-binding protein [Pseudoalteromonas sp. Of7M-16]MCG7550406.1 ATP-binding protein [Pseudoalteromonas sp. Of7M-16]
MTMNSTAQQAQSQIKIEKQLAQQFFKVGAALANNDQDLQQNLAALQKVLDKLVHTPRFELVTRVFSLEDFEVRLIALIYIQTLEPDILTPYLGLSWYEQGPLLSLDKLLFLCQFGGKRQLLAQGVFWCSAFKWGLLHAGSVPKLHEGVGLHSYLLQFLQTGKVVLAPEHPIKVFEDIETDPVFLACSEKSWDPEQANCFSINTKESETARWYAQQLAAKSDALFGVINNEQFGQLESTDMLQILAGVILAANGQRIFLYLSDFECLLPIENKLLSNQCLVAAKLHLFSLNLGLVDKTQFKPHLVEYHAPSIDSLARVWNTLSPNHDDKQAHSIAARYPVSLYRMNELAQQAKAHSSSSFWPALQELCLRELNQGPEELAKLSEPRFMLSDMVLSSTTADQLTELVGRVEMQSHLKLKLPRFTPGCKALFWGKPGTGKSMAAEAIAGELQLPLYVVNLANIASKWIGETEKHLAKLFDEAQKHNAVLMFDEADAVFAKRSAVESSQDKNANMGVSYLLQRMEHYSGLLLLSTNLKSNLDDAFLRRFHNVIEFTLPTPSQRLQIWRQVLASNANEALMQSIDDLAQRFELSAAQIINITESALLQRLMVQEAHIDPISLANALKRELAKQHEGFMAQHEIKAWLQGN